MSPRERLDLEKMLNYLPELKALRDFVDRLEMLFEEDQSEALAWGRHAALTNNRRFLAVPELAAAMEMLRVRPVNCIFKAWRRFVKMGPVRESSEAPPWLSRPARSSGRQSSPISAARD
jgi:hypothetical protein